MGYFYDSIKKALGGDKSSSSFNRNWTPNNIKCLVLSRDYIFIAYHTKRPLTVSLNSEDVLKDLQNYSDGRGKGALHNLLSERQLSCMEEFYVDGMFQNYPKLLDMNMYLGRLLNERSRLRSYGYGSFSGNSSSNDLFDRFEKARYSLNFNYSLALDTTRSCKLDYKPRDGSETWYKNYFLRPATYSLDADKGALAVYLRKAEVAIEKEIATSYEINVYSKRVELLSLAIAIDLDSIKSDLNLSVFLAKVKKSADKDLVHRVFLESSCLSEKPSKESIRAVGGIPTKLLKDALAKAIKIEKGVSDKLMKSYIDVLKVSVSEEGDFDESSIVELIKKGTGLTGYNVMLNNYAIAVTDKLASSGFSFIVKMALLKNADTIPSGAFRDKFIKSNSKNVGTIGLIDYLYFAAGLSRGKGIS